MELISFNEFIIKYPNFRLAISMGDFEFLHMGHQLIVSKLIEEKKNCSAFSALLTFTPHPKTYFQKDYEALNSIEDTYFTLKDLKLDLDYLIYIDIDKEFITLSAEAFIDDYLKKLNIVSMVEGNEFCFGLNGKGNKDLIISSYPKDFRFISIPDVFIEDKKVSSSLIKRAIKEDELVLVSNLLNHPLISSSVCVHGSGLGKRTGFPTINLKENNLLKNLADGVYAVKVSYNDQDIMGMLNIGHNPTYNYQQARRYEIHLFDFNEELYDELVVFKIYKYLRSEKKFATVDELIKELKSNKLEIIDYFNKL